jgi:hypothetical protein
LNGRCGRSIHDLPGAIDRRADERIPDRRSFNEIDRTAEKNLQCVGEIKELAKRIELPFSLELDQEIHVAPDGIKIHAACGRAEHFEPRYVIPLAERFQSLALIGDFGVHNGLRLGLFPDTHLASASASAPATGRAAAPSRLQRRPGDSGLICRYFSLSLFDWRDIIKR